MVIHCIVCGQLFDFFTNPDAGKCPVCGAPDVEYVAVTIVFEPAANDGETAPRVGFDNQNPQS